MTISKSLSTRPENAYRLTVRPQLAEFDLGGVLYHANYFHLYERAREGMLSDGGVSYPALVERHQHLAVTESGQEFLRPVSYGSELSIFAWCSAIKQASVIIWYEIEETSSVAVVLHRAFTKHVLVETEGPEFGIKQFSPELRAIFQQHSDASADRSL